MPVNSPHDDRSAKQLEAAARVTMEQFANRTLTDAEWASVRTRFLEFARIVRGWDKPPRRGTVEMLCQRER
jgi:hypothetical protein